MEAQIRYIAIRSHQPDVLAQFYREYFDMDELARSDDGDIALSDGFYNLSLLRAEENDQDLGFSHLGVAVDDLHELVMRIEKFAPPQTRLMADEGDCFHGEYRLADPNGYPVTVSTTNFGVPKDDGEKRLPAIHHIALSVPNQQSVLDFYMDVFGFRRQVSSLNPETGTVTPVGYGAADGRTALQMLVYPVTTNVIPEYPLGPRYSQFGVNHFGWLVPDLELALKSLPEGSVTKRPAIRPMAEYRGLDPDGNEFDLSQHKGYQIDTDVWVKA